MSQSHHPEHINSGDTSVNNVSGVGNAVGAGAQAIVTIYQTLFRPLPVNLSSLVRPLIRRYALEPFGGRDAELAMLDAFLADLDHPFGLLVAPTGLGKTALLIHWIARLQQQKTPWRVIFAPVSIRYQTASEHATLSILAHSLAELHNDLEQFQKQDHSPQYLRALVNDYLERPLPDGTQLLLVLDGIDEAIGWEIGPLCSVFPQAGLKILIAARQRATMTREDWRYHLDWQGFDVLQLDLTSLDRPAVEMLLKQNNVKFAHDPAFVNQFYRVSEGDPLTCNLLLKALKEGKITSDSLTHRPPGLEAFLKDWVETLEARRKVSAPIRELLALCAAAYGPLTSDDLQALAPDVFEEQATISNAIRDDDIDRFIIAVGKHTYVFSHQRLREVFLERIYPSKDLTKLQQRLIDYGVDWYLNRSHPLPDYLRQFWMTHLREAGEWKRIQQVTTEIVPSTDGKFVIQPWQTARSAVEGSDTSYLADLELLWSWAEQQNDLTLICRCALIAASLRSRSGNFFPQLLVQLVNIGTPDGVWSPVAVLEQILHMPDSNNQVACLQALLKAEISLPWQRALEVVRSISNSWNRVRALTDLAPHLPHELLPETLQACQAISDEKHRAQALTTLAPLLSSDQQADALAGALQACQAISDEKHRAQALTTLAPLLSSDQQADALAGALQACQGISDERSRTEALIALTSYLPSNLFPEAFLTANAISNEQERARILRALAPHLPPDLMGDALISVYFFKDKEIGTQVFIALVRHLPQDLITAALQFLLLFEEKHLVESLVALAPHLPSDLLTETLQAAQAISNRRGRAKSLIALAPRLPSNQQKEVLAEILLTANTISDERDRTYLLTTLASHVPFNQQKEVLAEILLTANTISDERDRAHLLTTLASRVPSNQQQEILADALHATYAISDERDRTYLLRTLAPSLSHELLVKAFQAACAISNNWESTRALSAIAPYLPFDLLAETLQTIDKISYRWYNAEELTTLISRLPSDQQKEVLAEALQATYAISDERDRTHLLRTIVPRLSHDHLANALHSALTTSDTRVGAQVLSSLAPHLTSNLLAEALKTIYTIADQDYRVEALSVLAPYLPPSLLAEALVVSRAISDQHYQAEALTALAPYLSLPFLSNILQTVHAIGNEQHRTQALIALILYLPPDLLVNALQIVCTISDELSRAWILTVFASHLPSDLLADAFQAADTITNQNYRAQALTALTSLQSNKQPKAVLGKEPPTVLTISDKPNSDTSNLESDLLVEALQATSDELSRASKFSFLAPKLALEPSLDHLFPKILRTSTRRGRPVLLSELAALAPWLIFISQRAQQPTVIEELAKAIIDTARCWP
jgi:hypothetical protein